MKYFLILLLAVSISNSATAQPLFSGNGGVHTPKGDLHILMVFVRYEDHDAWKGTKAWPDETAEDKLPLMSVGTEMNTLFNAQPETIGGPGQIPNISDFYYTMSGGEFRITGDIFPVQVPVPYVGEASRNFFSRQRVMNASAVDWIVEHYPDFDWGKYDRRTNNPQYRFDNTDTKPDSILDYIIFMHRIPGSTGMGASSSIDIPNSVYKIRNGHTGLKSFAEKEHNWEYFKHEFSHNLYSSPHYCGANGSDGDKYYQQKGWGLMSAGSPPFMTANAWECWWLDWLKPQEISRNGQYQLKDFITGRDAVRIQIPGTEDYLFLENHQKVNSWDSKIFYKNPDKGQPQSAKGLYAYVVAAPGADRNRPKLNPFNPKHVNLIKLLNGEGHYDYEQTGDTLRTKRNRYQLVFRKGRSNPIAGQNDLQGIRGDYDGNGRIDIGFAHGNADRGGKEQKPVWVDEYYDGEHPTYNSTGDEKDAFQVGDEISLSGKLPVVNYPIYQRKEDRLAPFKLNGISIRIVDQDESGTYTLDIRFDDWEIRNNQRWCGNILLPSPKGEKDRYLTLAPKVELTVDLSGTADRSKPHPETGVFVNPTILQLGTGKGMRLKRKSRLIIAESSTLDLRGNAQIIIEKGARLIVKTNAKLLLDERSQIIVKKGGRLIIEHDGFLQKMRDANVKVEKGGKFVY